VSFDFLHNQIVLTAAINGRGAYNFLLDTGTHGSTIDLRLARRLGLLLAAAGKPVAGAGRGRVPGRQTVCERLSVGGLTVRGLTVTAVDLQQPARELGRPIDGVLGFGFLAARITQIDYFRRRIRFYSEPPFAPAAQPPDTSRRISFPMQFRAGSVLPVLEQCRVNGTEIAVTLDTGSSLGLILFPHAVRLLGLQGLARAGIALDVAGYRGRARLMKGWVRSVELKSIGLGAVETAFVMSGYGDGEDVKQRGGTLGNAILQDFILTLDYPHRVVVLESAWDPLEAGAERRSDAFIDNSSLRNAM
jgi:predicted aspartyl protease